MTSAIIAGYEHVEEKVGGTLWVSVSHGGVSLSFLPQELFDLAQCLHNRSGLPLKLDRIRLEFVMCGNTPYAKLLCGSSVGFLIGEKDLEALVVYWLDIYAPAEVVKLSTPGIA